MSFPELLFCIFIMVAWIYEGFALKFIDLYIDDGMKVHPLLLYAVMLTSGLFGAILACIDLFSLSAISALIIGVIITKKIDNRLWVIQICIVVSFYILFLMVSILINPGYHVNVIDGFILFLIIGFGTAFDEFSHDKITRMNDCIFKRVFQHRLVMKVLVFVLVPLFPDVVYFYHGFGWLGFDFLYDLTAWVFYRRRAVVSNPRHIA
ncbi:MAG: hypothetical protein ACTSWN_07335 [Promethearchaeota archaeon]